MSSLANVYATLQSKCSNNLMVSYALPATYLANIIGPEEAAEKVVFVLEEDRSKASGSNFLAPSKLNIKKSPQFDLDLTGSPLKDDCVVEALDDLSLDFKLIAPSHWTWSEECHKGLTVEKARNIICSEDFQNVDEQAQGSVWFLCNAANAERTLFLQYEFAKNYFSRGTISFLGIEPTYKVITQSLLKHHFVLRRAGMPVETRVDNVYHMKPDIELRCSWSTDAELPALIDLSTCDVTLAQTFRSSSCGPLTQDFMNQLRILMFIRDDILAYRKAAGDDTSCEVAYRCGRGIDIEELRENITKVMTEITGFVELEAASGNEHDIESVIQCAKTRHLTSLTDKLWEILKCCSSYKDLKAGFNIVFQCSARCNIVNTPTNKNRLAEIITEVANKRLAIPCLTGTEPLELLLEIGLEKLYKDYEFIFEESKICSANELRNTNVTCEANKENEDSVPNVRKSLRNAVRVEPSVARKTLLHNMIKGERQQAQSEDIVGFKNSHFDEQQTALDLSKLLQIHCTLEHLLMMHIHLSLSNVYGDVCSQLLRKPARLVESIDENLIDKMEITLAVHEVREHLQGKDPYTRRIIMKSGNQFREVTTCFFYSMENVCPPGVSEHFKTDEKETVKQNTYFSWLYRKIKTKH